MACGVSELEVTTLSRDRVVSLSRRLLSRPLGLISTDKMEPMLMSDDFHFSSMETTEDMTHYIPGGYHPVIIGDSLSPSPENQYRIMHKLGFGSYATVWLAQRTDYSKGFDL